MGQIAIRYSRTTQLTEAEAMVWDVLSTSCRGRAQASTQATLSVAVGMPARELRQIIKDLIEKHRLPIGSAPNSPPGYFVIETEEEACDVCERYYRGALSLLYRMRVLKDMSAHELSRQIEMDLRE